MRISDWSSDVCSSDLQRQAQAARPRPRPRTVSGAAEIARTGDHDDRRHGHDDRGMAGLSPRRRQETARRAYQDRKSTRLNSSTNAQLVCRLMLEKKNKIDTEEQTEVPNNKTKNKEETQTTTRAKERLGK